MLLIYYENNQPTQYGVCINMYMYDFGYKWVVNVQSNIFENCYLDNPAYTKSLTSYEYSLDRHELMMKFCIIGKQHIFIEKQLTPLSSII